MILVTGGTGFIGSHMVTLLLEQGQDVIVVDNLCNSSADVVTRITQITGTSPIFKEADVRDRDAIAGIFAEYDIVGVIHFAALKAVGESMQKPYEYYDNNLVGTLNLLEVMQEYGVKDIVFSSSCTVYGDSQQQPLTESSPKQPCTSPYGWTKSINEDMLLGLAQSTHLRVCALRYFNPIGAHPSGLIGEEPRGVPENLLPYVIKTLKGEYEYLSVFGDDYDTMDGTCIRDYIHVMDLVEAHLVALQWLSKQQKGCFETFNIGTGVGASVLDIIKATQEVVGKKVPYKIVDRRPGDVVTAYADSTKAREVLGREAKRTVREAIGDMWRFEGRGEGVKATKEQ